MTWWLLVLLGVVGVLAFLAALSRLSRYGGLPTAPADRDLEAEHDDHQRQHLAGEDPAVVTRHLTETYPDLLERRCPHLPAHRRIITAPTGPLESPEVVAYLCTLCGHQTYVAGPYDHPAP